MSIYKKAAEALVENDRNDADYRFACLVIRSVGGNDSDIEKMESHFKSENNFNAWYSEHEDGEPDLEFKSRTKLGNLGRSLMLLFMHEIYMDKFKKRGPKKGAAKKWSERLKQIGEQAPPDDLMKALNESEIKPLKK